MAEQSNKPRDTAPLPAAAASAAQKPAGQTAAGQSSAGQSSAGQTSAGLTPATRPDTPTEAETSRSLAIALSSKGGRAQATQVTAKGTGEIAEQILQLAFEHGVKVRTDADLATILSAVEVESEIPLEALTAVANILSYIYRAEHPSVPESQS